MLLTSLPDKQVAIWVSRDDIAGVSEGNGCDILRAFPVLKDAHTFSQHAAVITPERDVVLPTSDDCWSVHRREFNSENLVCWALGGQRKVRYILIKKILLGYDIRYIVHLWQHLLCITIILWHTVLYFSSRSNHLSLKELVATFTSGPVPHWHVVVWGLIHCHQQAPTILYTQDILNMYGIIFLYHKHFGNWYYYSAMVSTDYNRFTDNNILHCIMEYVKDVTISISFCT